MTSSAIETHPRAEQVRFTDEEIVVALADGRKISVPIVWFPRLADAAPGERENYELMGDGEGIHWPDLDEDLSVQGLLAGHRPNDTESRPGYDPSIGVPADPTHVSVMAERTRQAAPARAAASPASLAG
ncbi:MAG: DUF2442 domain-containing protein [Thiohalorhabdaceae bacterium]